jgi:hypothetical protein
MSKPLLFISHKHTDHAIAKVIGDFINDESRNEVDLHLSSDPKYQGPRFGPNLNAQLRQTLWKTDALILVYTSTDGEDWSYCMWECGAAAHPDSPNTTLIVFQCWRDVPKPFADDLRVNARGLDDIKKFTKQLLTSTDFFPRLGRALAPMVEQETINKAANRLYENLRGVLPHPDDGAIQHWPTWPYLRVELPMPHVDAIKAAPEGERRAKARELVTEHGVVVEGGERTAELFGLANLSPRHAFKEMLRTWSEKTQATESLWFDSCCEQIASAALRQFPVIRPATLREANGDAEFTPALSRTRRLPFAKVMQFDIYFYNLSDPRAVPVTSRMLPVEDVYLKNIGDTGPQGVKLGGLLDELKREGKSRVPLVDAQTRPLYIVHRSMVDQFMLERARAGATTSQLNDLTLADLFAEPGMQEMFETTFAVVAEQATLADVRIEMANSRDIRDVFVTAEGKRDGPIKGWLTNVDLISRR